MLLGGAGAFLLASRPQIGADGQPRLFNSADAWIWAALSLAASVASLFVKSDGGLGAMLNSSKDLSEVNIALSQNIISEIGNLQRDVANLPERMRVVLIENEQYKVRHYTGSITLNLQTVQENLNSRVAKIGNKEIRQQLNQCIEWGNFLAGAQFVPYGIGPMGAMCVPVIAASVAKAHALLGNEELVRADIKTKYLPWLVRIRDSSVQGSLLNLLLHEGEELQKLESNLGQQLSSERLRNRLKADINSIALLPAGGYYWDIPVSCVSYVRQIGTRERHCVESITHGRGDLSIERCIKWEAEPIYAEGTKRNLTFVVRNTTSDKGPSMEMASKWVDVSRFVPSIPCEEGDRGPSLLEADEAKKITESNVAKAWQRELDELNSKGLQALVAQREIIWSYFNLLESAREAEQRIREVFSL
jgi:hypothetical protein